MSVERTASHEARRVVVPVAKQHHRISLQPTHSQIVRGRVRAELRAVSIKRYRDGVQPRNLPRNGELNRSANRRRRLRESRTECHIPIEIFAACHPFVCFLLAEIYAIEFCRAAIARLRIEADW